MQKKIKTLFTVRTGKIFSLGLGLWPRADRRGEYFHETLVCIAEIIAFAKIARDFQIILKHAPATLILNVLWVVYIFRKGVHLSIFY